MQSLFTTDSLVSLITLTFLEIVLGIDNVIFVSILISSLNKKQQLNARKIWIIAGILVRSGLLLIIGWFVNNGNKKLPPLFGYEFDIRSIIMLLGGLFLLYKTVREIHTKLDAEDHEQAKKPLSFAMAVSQIILIDAVFSFDSIITAVGLARRVPVMITAVVIAMLIMFFFSQAIAHFIQKHPTLKMLALAFLLMIGFSLFFEGLEPIHHSHIDKGYIYFAMAFSFGVEMLNLWMKKKQNKKVEADISRKDAK